MHILQNSFSCNDLIFTSQPNLGAYSSIHSSCHNSIVLAKFDFKICYPPPYSKEVWNVNEAETDLNRRSLNDLKWERAFSNTSVNGKVCIFNKFVLNILSNLIPHNTILCHDKDPLWFNSRIKSLLQVKNNVFKNYIQKEQNQYSIA